MLIPNYTLSIILMLLIPVVLAAWLRRRFPVPWLLFAVGMATFAAAQAVHIPLNNLLSKWGILPQAGAINQPAVWQTALVLGLTAALCEEFGRVIAYAIMRRYRSFEAGVMMGLGHGGIEAMILGGMFTAATVSVLLPISNTGIQQLALPVEQAVALQLQIDTLLASPWSAFLPLIERLLAISIQVFLSVLVLKAFQRHNAWFVVLAITYHMLLDAALVILAQKGLSPWLIEGCLALLALPGWVWLAILFRQRASQIEYRPAPLTREASVFLAALGKELLEMMRTRRILIVAAVFGLWGMASPLFAYFMPQMFAFIPGAEQFSSLIPTPTITDALTQYIKNISQFAFILAIILGMGAVAGEKEKGTASLVLSKPLPRSTFITSKFFAQILVYLGGFILALIGAYFYTVILFGSLKFSVISQVTILLFLWLLPFVAITLLGSTIGKSTSAAAGLAAVGSIALMLLANIPPISKFMPAALMGWASQIGLTQVAVAVNGGALAFCLALLLILLVTSVAIFEQQEL
jgi:ABC-2 type transport system permease protein